MEGETLGNRSIIDVLLDEYIRDADINAALEAEREEAALKLDNMLTTQEASDALIEFHHAATRAAFHAGFKTAIKIIQEAR